MSRRFTAVTLALTAIVAFLVGAIVAGGGGRSSGVAGAPPGRVVTEHATERRIRAAGATAPITVVNFADIVERINPAVVNIEATTRGIDVARRRRARPDLPDVPEPFNGTPGTPRNDRDAPRRGAGTGFIIDAD